MAESSALSHAMRLLVKRDLTVAEIRRKLEAKRFDELEIDEALAWLHAKGLIDDARVVEARVEALTLGKGAGGRLKVRAKLVASGASTDLIESSIETISDDDELARMGTLLEAKFKHERDRVRAGRFLLARGFEPDLVEIALDRWIDA